MSLAWFSSQRYENPAAHLIVCLGGKVKTITILLVLLIVSGCATTFDRVDFKYSNLAHMDIKDAFVIFDNTDPEKLIFALSEAFRSKAYEIIERKKLDFYYVETPSCEKCAEADREIFQQEFSAYRANSFPMYKSIDRNLPYLGRGITPQCKKLEKVIQSGVNSWYLEVEIPQGDFSTTVTIPDVKSFFLFNGSSNPITAYGIKNKSQTVSTSFASRLYVWAWHDPGTSKTVVYLEAKPINGQIIANPGNSIGYSWWKQANGYAEFKLVKHYVLLLQELKRAENILKKIDKREKFSEI